MRSKYTNSSQTWASSGKFIKTQMLAFTPGVIERSRMGLKNSIFVKSSHMVLMLLTQVPYFENQWENR